MKHLAALVFSFIVFAFGTTLLVLGRASIATSLPLLLTIVASYVVALAVAFPTQTVEARAQLTAWLNAWKNPTPKP